MSKPKLLVILPVFNESESIRHVVNGWTAALDQTVGDYLILAINDGSTDDSSSILKELHLRYGDKLEMRSRENRGHGQSCMEGYLLAIERSIPHILQIDSDGQSDPCHLACFWEMRDSYDVIYGKRKRFDGQLRIIASFVLRHLLRVCEGVDCVDANVPYRLMNTFTCAAAIRSIPSSISLANVALAVILKRDHKLRHGEIPVNFPPRHGGEPSVPLTKFLQKACELLTQLRRLRKTPRT
jgi:glycosyltransferase involved in cell wall biosynthesis